MTRSHVVRASQRFGPMFWLAIVFAIALMLVSLVRHASAQPPPPAAPPDCDSIDFNQDGIFPDTADIDAFRDVLAGTPCPACQDIDFNNDGLFPDTADLDAFLRVFSGGPCHLPPADDGWTEQPLAPGAIARYVSDFGSASNDGLTLQTPKASWPEVWNATRSGTGDHVYIVDRLTVPQGLSLYSKSGASPTARLVIRGVRSDGKPGGATLITTTGGTAAVYISGSRVSHFALMDLDIQNADPATRRNAGIETYINGTDWLIEGLRVQGFRSGINLQAAPADPITFVRFRRCDFSQNWSTTSHSQGAYLQNVQDVDWDECVLSDNGEGYPGGASTMYNHQMYVQQGSTRVTVRNTVVGNSDGFSSATGLQMRWNEQHAIGNLVINMAKGITFGFGGMKPYYPAQHVTGSAMGNFIVGTADIGSGESNWRGGEGIGFGLADGVTISGNFIIDGANARLGAIRSDEPSTNVRVIGNYSDWPTPIMQWAGNASSAEPSNMVDVDQEPRTVPRIEAYLIHHGVTPATKARFIELARENIRPGLPKAWDARWTAEGYIRWAKASSN